MLPYTYFVFYLGIPDHRDMDSFASGGGPGHRFSMQDDDEEDDEATAMAMANRQSVIKFNVREEEEDDLERETAFVRQKTPHPKELKAKAHKLFGNKKPLEESNVEDEVAIEHNQVQNGGVQANSEIPTQQRAFFAESEPVVHEAENNFDHQNEDEEAIFRPKPKIAPDEDFQTPTKNII